MLTRIRISHINRFVLALFIITGMLGIKPIKVVHASSITVVNTNDSGTGSLRQAIADAVSGDTIAFDPTLSSGTIHLVSTLTLSKDIILDGSMLASPITVSGDNLYRVFYINSGVTVTLDGLIIAHGKAHFGLTGGGIYNSGALTVTNSIISENTATYGGGIFNKGGNVTIDYNSIITQNNAYLDGGGIYSEGGTLTVSKSTLSNNNAITGGGVYNQGGTVTVSKSTFSYNSGDPQMSSYAGGIFNIGTLTISDSTFSNNSAQASGGGIFHGSGTLTITNSVFSDNRITSYLGVGGGIKNNDTLIINNSTFSGNSAELGGAIYNNGLSGILTVTDSIFSGNSAASEGGGIFNYSTLTAINTTFSGNSTTDSGSTVNSGNGGGITNYRTASVMSSTFFQNSAYTGGGISNLGTLTVTNSTFSGNKANWGGGLANTGDSIGATATVVNSTFFANDALYGSGIANMFLSYQKNSVLNYINTIVAKSTSGEDCYNAADIGTNINNLVEDGSCSASLSGNPMLGDLANNGGPTFTYALQINSPAIDTGDDTSCPPIDQREVVRPQGHRCDIGAYEYESELKIIHVKWDATGTNTGISWKNAFTDLQSAISAAEAGEEIWVAAGTYKPTTGIDRAISFTLKNGVALYGGFKGAETQRAQRNFAANVTVLSGDIGTAGINTDNSYHVMVASSVDNNTILDGFTITAGNANGVSPYDSGGGIYNDKGSLGLNDVVFTDNYAALFGGGLYTFYGDHTNLILTGVVFSNNTADGGGGIATNLIVFPLPAAPFGISLTNVTFENNISGRVGGGMSNVGGDLTLLDVTFTGNTARAGGGLTNTPYISSSILTNVTFSNNSADDGGGGMLVGSDSPIPTTLTNVTFSDNSTAMNGGGIANAGSSDLILTNVTFSGNTAGMNGGGIYNGRVLSVEGTSTITLTNATLSNNVANSHGGAIYNESGDVDIHNSILYGNSGEEIHNNSTTTNVSYSIVQGGYSGTGNLDVDPLLGPLQDNGGFTKTMALGEDSPALNAGNDANCPATDQRGVKRPQGSHCDIGAYEEIAPTRPVLKSKALHPSSWNTQSGTTDGSSSNLNLLDQTGTDDNPAAYISFQTPDGMYLGYQSFSLPQGTQAKLISTMLLQLNVKTPATSTQVWTWSIYDPTSNLWIKVGDSLGTEADQWQSLVFRIRQPWRYVSSGNEIRIQLKSNNAEGDARVDYEALHVTYLSIPILTPVAPTVSPNRPGIFSLPNLVPTATPKP